MSGDEEDYVVRLARRDAAARAGATPTWTTRDGREIAVRDMEDDHLANAIRWLERRRVGAERVRHVALFLHGPRPSGEFAQEAYEAEGAGVVGGASCKTFLLALLVYPKYCALVAERDRRCRTKGKCCKRDCDSDGNCDLHPSADRQRMTRMRPTR